MSALATTEPVEVMEDDRIGELLEQRKGHPTPWFSFEFFPPKTPEGVEKLYERLAEMAPYNPLFVDFTWGAGGSTAELTLELTIEARRRFGLIANMHLTCTNMPTEKVVDALKSAKDVGITNILALRGDPPVGQERWEPIEGGFSSALDLVAYIRKHHDTFFSVGVAGYPEGHPNRIQQVDSLEGLSKAELGRVAVERAEDGTVTGYYVCRDNDFVQEIDYLKAKVDAGADFVITQMFFDAEVYVAFVKTCRSAGITVPILPGIMCFNTLQGFKRMVAFCRTRVPEKLWMDMMALSKSDDDEVRRYGIDFGVRLGQELLRAGSSGLHFYCLNLSRVALGIVSGLGLGSQSVDATYTNEKVEFETEKAMNGSDKVKSKEKALSNHDHVGAVASS